MTRAEEITQLRAEVRRLRAALSALVGGGNPDAVAAFDLGRQAERSAREADSLSGYDQGFADGLARKPMAGVDPTVLEMGERISDRLTGTEPRRHLRPVPTSPA